MSMAATQELKANCRPFSLVQLMLLLNFAVPLSEATGKVGVNYGTLGNNLPSASQTASLLLNTTLRNVKIYNPDQSIMQAFANTSVKLIIGVPTESIPVLATSAASAQLWLQANVATYMPATQVTCLAVGNEVLMNSPSLSPQLLPAMTNLHAAITALNLSIQVGTPHNLQVLEKSFPPSSGAFSSNLTTNMKAILGFLNATKGPLMVNLYPYFAYRNDPGNVSLAFALFNTTTDESITDANTGLRYSNMLDAQLDAVYSAMERLGFRDVIPIVVSETGWPSGGDLAATPTNAQLYNMNLIKYVAGNNGTPLRPGTSIDAYIFALFNENLKPGSSSERFFGLFNANRTPAYNLGSVMANATTPPPPNPNPNLPVPPPATPLIYPPPAGFSPPPLMGPVPAVPGPTSPGNDGKTWCVAKAGAGDDDVARALAYACGEAGVDCGAIQSGGACYYPNSMASHASVAFNSYYQKMGRNYWNCYFGGTGLITAVDPSYAGCSFH